MEKTKGFKLMQTIGRDISIFPGKEETKDHYMDRVILSAGAAWMLTAVHNQAGKVSVESIKETAREKIAEYLKIAGRDTMPDIQLIVNCLYQTLLNNGMFYHEPHNVRPARHGEIALRGISIIRGLLPEEKVSFAGMAPYVTGYGDADPAECFMLWDRDAEETIRSAWKHSSPQEDTVKIDQYLRIKHKPFEEYYDYKRRDEAECTLGRSKKTEGFGYDYFILRGRQARRLTDDYINAYVHDYLRIAIVNGEEKQVIHAKLTDNLVEVRISYKLPIPEERFLRFISWPEDNNKLKDPIYNISLHPRVWPVVKERMEYLGYRVEEQHE